MIGVVLFTHGALGQSLIDAVELIAGKQENVVAVGLEHYDCVTEFETKCLAALAAADDGDGVLVFVDIRGGTPANSMLIRMRENITPCIAGVNMPMLIEALTAREEYESPQELEAACAEIGRAGIVIMGSLRRNFEGNHLNDIF